MAYIYIYIHGNAFGSLGGSAFDGPFGSGSGRFAMAFALLAAPRSGCPSRRDSRVPGIQGSRPETIGVTVINTMLSVGFLVDIYIYIYMYILYIYIYYIYIHIQCVLYKCISLSFFQQRLI